MRPRTIAVYNFKGGVGKTATAVNVAYLSARAGEPTLLWDLDPQGAASFTFRVKPKVRGGGAPLLEDGRGGDAVRATDFEGLDLLPADFSYRRLDRVAEERAGALAGRLRSLGSEYGLVVVDCAPSLGPANEAVFDAADALLAPTIPTPLSLRTLARLLEHLKKRPRGRRPRVLSFFCMVDRRKALHRRVCAWAAEQGLGFLAAEIPYSSSVERMSVERGPLGAFAPRDRAAVAYGELWNEVRERMEKDEGGEPSRDSVRALLERAARAGGRPRAASDEVELKLAVAGEAELSAVAEVLARRGAPPAEPAVQVNHFFDTAAGDLRRRGLVIRLREEEGRAFLTIKGRGGDAEGDLLHARPELEVEVPEPLVRTCLARRALPLEAFARAGVGDDALLAEARAVLGPREPMHVGSFRNVRTRVRFPAGEGDGLVLELDRTEYPGGRVDCEVELEVPPGAERRAAELLAGVLVEARVEGRRTTSKAERFFACLAEEGRGDDADAP